MNMTVAEAIKSSEIEVEFFSRQDIVSSIRINFDMNHPVEATRDKMAQGAAMRNRCRLCFAPLVRIR
ncbi:hypothetical protein [Pontibacter mangrovi]|uniref:Uncharacterized protein n=1 Tax=Pontibacter mangrovi TaxID=2589816 RepID=A0A501W2C2_9BACT|nr:hypothetical protein [Pontibacter mangrovi]TPE42430.1 hypothetical protein FJM65_18220 [Pontibacter mangrovi]